VSLITSIHSQWKYAPNVFFQYYGKLWNTTNINELQLEHNSADYLHDFIILDELEKALK
jgi:hypothetical protein